jgi:uncharacterized repeat protein (TIGR01451 family)
LFSLCLCAIALAVAVPLGGGPTRAQDPEPAPPPSGKADDPLPPFAPLPSANAPEAKKDGASEWGRSGAEPAKTPSSIDGSKGFGLTGAQAAPAPPLMTKVRPQKPAALVPVGEAEHGPAPEAGKAPAFRLVGAAAPQAAGPSGTPETTVARRIALSDQPVGIAASPGQAPALTLQKIGPAAVTLGEPYTYEIVVHNLGTVPALEVRLADNLPAGAQLLDADPKPERLDDVLAWPLGTLDAGAVRRVKCTVRPTAPIDRLPAAHAGFAAAPAEGLHSNLPQAAVKAAGPTTAAVGHPAVFAIEITNPAGVPLAGLLLRAHLSAGLRHERGADIEADLATLAPGETRKISLPARAAQAGRQQMECTVLAKDGRQTAAQAAVEVTGPDLRVRLTGPTAGLVGHEVEYHLEVSNRGTGPAANVDVSNFLPAGLDFAAAGEGGTYDATTRSVNWLVPSLAPGQARGMSLKLLPRGPGDLHNPVRARCEEGAEAKDEAALHVEGVSALRVEITNKDSQVEVGAETNYEVRVSNQGNVPGTGVQVVLTVPDGLKPLTAEGPTSYRTTGQQIIFEPLDKLTAGSAVSFRVRAKGAKAGDWRFKAQLTSDQTSRPVTQEENTLVYQAGK